MPHSKSPLSTLCYLAAVYIALLGICLWTHWTLFCWLIIGVVFGIPAFISMGLFVFFMAVALRWVIARCIFPFSFHGHPRLPGSSNRSVPGGSGKGSVINTPIRPNC